MFFRTAWLVLRKDVAIEVKSLEVLTTTLFFAIACVLIFAFAFVKNGQAPEDAAAGILWIAIAFSGTLALGRTFERERYAETLRALLLAPAPRPALYVGKLLGMLALLASAELLLVPLIAFLFQAALFSRPLLLVGILAGGTIGFCAVGTLFAAMLVRARSRDVLLPILLYVDRDPGGVRRRVRHAFSLDVRATDDGVTGGKAACGRHLDRFFSSSRSCSSSRRS